MELQIPYYILFTFFCFILMFWTALNSKKSTKNLPPGPWKLPLIGNIHQFVGSHPHHILTDLATKYGPIMHIKLGETSNVVVSSPKIVKEIFKTHDAIFSDRPQQLATTILSYNKTDLIFSPYGKHWRLLRKICSSELFTAKRVQTFRSIREEEASELIKKLREREGSVVNLSKMIFALINDITARSAFGKKSRDQEAFLLCLEEVTKLCGGFSVVDLYPSITVLQLISGIRSKVERTHKKLDVVLENIITDHKQRNSETDVGKDEDLVDALLKIQQQNELEFPLTHDIIKGVISDVFLAGTESSSTTMIWVMSSLIRNPQAMKEAQAEVRRVYKEEGFVDETKLHQLNYLKSVVKETLRLHPPAPLLLPRESIESCVINGYEIPAKSRLIVNFWAIGRDPKYWSEPEKFKPERFFDNSIDFKGKNFEYMPFGVGRRICPGITFAIPSVELSIAGLLYHFDWKLPNGMKHEELDMTESFGAAVGRKNDLCLTPICYQP